MTPLERHDPKILNGSRRLRIANGSGTTVTEVNQLVERFFAARTMMKQLSGMGPCRDAGHAGSSRWPPQGERRWQGIVKKKQKTAKRAGGRPGPRPQPTAEPTGAGVGANAAPAAEAVPTLPPGFPAAQGVPRPAAPRIALTEVASRSAARPPHPALHVRGIVLPDGQARDLWLADGQVRTTSVRDATSIGAGFLLPGLVDAHCHLGLGRHGPVPDRGDQEEQAIRVRTPARCSSATAARRSTPDGWMSAPTFPVSSAPVGILPVPGAICPAWARARAGRAARCGRGAGQGR